jgi:hypothetical protein
VSSGTGYKGGRGRVTESGTHNELLAAKDLRWSFVDELYQFEGTASLSSITLASFSPMSFSLRDFRRTMARTVMPSA